jgi:magnesium transporter
MGIVTHRTNALLSRLNVVGTLFLPLTFIAGVYGMNFRVMPELDWKYGTDT